MPPSTRRSMSSTSGRSPSWGSIPWRGDRACCAGEDRWDSERCRTVPPSSAVWVVGEGQDPLAAFLYKRTRARGSGIRSTAVSRQSWRAAYLFRGPLKRRGRGPAAAAWPPAAGGPGRVPNRSHGQQSHNDGRDHIAVDQLKDGTGGKDK